MTSEKFCGMFNSNVTVDIEFMKYTYMENTCISFIIIAFTCAELCKYAWCVTGIEKYEEEKEKQLLNIIFEGLLLYKDRASIYATYKLYCGKLL